MELLSPNLENLAFAAQALQRGELVGMPTETVYGLAGDCRNPSAVARIFEAKERPHFDPLIVHVSSEVQSLADLEALELINCSALSAPLQLSAMTLIRTFWPGPLTLVLPKHPKVLDLITAGLPTIALRMPQHPVAQALIQQAGTPLAAPSANRFGRISPTNPQAVIAELGDRVSWVIDGGPCQIGLESTVVRIDPTGQCWILRHGGVSTEALNEVLERASLTSVRTLNTTPPPSDSSSPTTQNNSPLASPGLLTSHYAPQKKLYLLPKKINQFKQLSELPHNTTPLIYGLLLLEGDPEIAATQLTQLTGQQTIARTLSITGELPEAAHHLFAELRFLDASPATVLLVEPWADSFKNKTGLGYAIADRLQRASVRS